MLTFNLIVSGLGESVLISKGLDLKILSWMGYKGNNKISLIDEAVKG